jgi:hypothetical protein
LTYILFICCLELGYFVLMIELTTLRYWMEVISW